MKLAVALNFNNLFPDEKELDVLDYLKRIPKKILLEFIGFCNTNPLPNYYNFFSKPEVSENIISRVNFFYKNKNSKNNLEVITPYSYLKFTEIVLLNINDFSITEEANEDIELNLFKAFLVLNSNLNDYNHDFNSEKGIESFVNFFILQSFQLSEISNYIDDRNEFIKLVYSTIYKVENLLDFLTRKGLINEKRKFIESFDFQSEKDFLYEMKYLFSVLLVCKNNNQYIFTNENFTSFKLIKNITLKNITENEDFTELKKYPIYFIEENRFSIINFYFVIDLFYRSAKFRLKEIFSIENTNHKDFFSFYTTEFSEKFLMKNLLDDIFSKTYFLKKNNYELEKMSEPDYYINYKNSIILFENKDILINKNIKSAREIKVIKDFLNDKLFQSKKKGVGIKQLVNSIESIYKKTFVFDPHINYNKKIEIYPILLLHDRIFQSFGINYILNNWFRNELLERNIINNDKFVVHSLTVIDIDTLIFWRDNIKNNFGLIKSLLLNHIKHLNEKPQKSYSNDQYFNNYLQRLLRPISSRNTPFFLPKDFSNQLLNLLKEEQFRPLDAQSFYNSGV